MFYDTHNLMNSKLNRRNIFFVHLPNWQMLKYQNVSGHQCIGTQVHKYTVNGCTNCSKLLMCSVVIFFKKYTQNILYLSNIFTDLKSKTFDWIPMEEREMYILEEASILPSLGSDILAYLPNIITCKERKFLFLDSAGIQSYH